MSPSQLYLRELAERSRLHVVAVETTSIAWRQWSGADAAVPTPANPEAPPLILIHGGFGSWTHWAENLLSLSVSREVWTVDLPGLGESGDMPQPQTLEHFTTLLRHSLAGVGLSEGTFEIAAFSFGAMIGARLAAACRHQCQRLTVIGAAGCGALHHQVDLLPLPAPGTPFDEAVVTHRENLARLMIADPHKIDINAIRIHSENLAKHRFRSRGLAGTDDLLVTLEQVAAPICAIWGSEDATAGGRDALEKRRVLFSDAPGGCDFHVLAGVGHWTMYEAPGISNALILRSER